MKICFGITVLLLVINYCYVDANGLTIVIRNMRSTTSQKKGNQMKEKLLATAKELGNTTVNVLALHEDWAPINAWTIMPIFEHLHDKYHTSSNWVFFCEETTEINLKYLIEVLSQYDHKNMYFLGHALHDEEVSIIHHFAFYQDPTVFKFPDFDAGWAVSMKLIKSAANRLKKDPPTMNFSIDIKHEVAMFFHDGGKGTALTDVPEFCINKPLKECASTVRYAVPDCGIVDAELILVAVKTCEKYHRIRVPIVKKTVGLHVKHIKYYSDVADDSIPTEYAGVKNTDSGHCQKLRNIIGKFADKQWQVMKWLVIIDDDTIMSFKRLQRLLACYNPDEPVLLGERYAYGINYHNWGYSYPTGGGGMIMSRKAVEQLLANERCPCQANDSPDDMWLGMCFRGMGIPMVHTNSFHQTRPSQYNKEFLSHRYLVSFHKHQYQDPIEIYREYLAGDPSPRDRQKTEL